MTSPTPPSEPAAPSAAQPTTAPPTDSERPSSRWAFVIIVVCDIVLPVGLYYALRAAGVDEMAALLLSGSAPALHTLHTAVRHRKLDAVGVFTVALLVVSALASLLTSDPRIALARNGLFTALAGVWLLITLFTARPFTYQALRTLMPGRSAKLEQLWESDATFRRVWRGLTTLWAIGLLCDALLRVIMAYTLPVDVIPALDGVLYAVSWIILQVITQIVLFRTRTLTKIMEGREPGRRLFPASARQPGTGD
ncbi:VC0807 family protein [Streptomyces sp. NPDC058735]|uniref:VC0807 family protein n=1 Tax=unclassified Streptomyces TaxID=2593676 RepID=UPI0036776AE7